MTRWAIVTLGGAVICTLADQLHVGFGVLTYSRPFVAGQALWVPFLFAGAVVSMVGSYDLLVRQRQRAPAARELVAALTWFYAAYLVSCLAGPRSLVASALLVGAFAARLVRAVRAGEVRPERLLRIELPWVLGACLVGPAVEATLVALGLFRYARPELLGVPLWLPALYLHGAWAGRAMARAPLGTSSR